MKISPNSLKKSSKRLNKRDLFFIFAIRGSLGFFEPHQARIVKNFRNERQSKDLLHKYQRIYRNQGGHNPH